MASNLGQIATKQVRPLISATRDESRRNVLKLYKSWHKNLLFIIQIHNLPISLKTGRTKIKEMFIRNRDVADIRVIDMLTQKGQMELDECVNVWKQKTHIMAYFKDVDAKPKDFLNRFLKGHE